MNILHGKVIEVLTSEQLSLVKVAMGETLLSAIVIDTPKTCPYLVVGHSVQVIFKETEVVIGKGDNHNDISLRNKLIGTINHIEKGDLLSKVSINTDLGQVVSIITTTSLEQLNLVEGDLVTAMIKTNEVMLSSHDSKNKEL